MLALPAAASPAAPAVVIPGPNEVSYGHLIGTVGPRTRRVLVSIDGRLRADRAVRGPRFDFTIALPRRDVALTVSAVDDRGRRASTVVRPVYGLPRSAAPRGPPLDGHEDTELAARIRALAGAFPGTCAIFVQDLRDGAGAAWNARARLPAASTLKVAIAVEVLGALTGKPAVGSRIDALLHQMLVSSDSKAANQLLVWLGGSTSGGSARVNAGMRALGLTDTDMYGGYELPRSTSGRHRRPIPLRVESQPTFVGKYTTAWDYGRLLRSLHLASEGRGVLAQRVRGRLTPPEARYLLYVLAHTAEPNRLDRYLRGGGVAVLQKAGWIEQARHDGGLVYWPGGALVAVVMTWNGRGVGTSSDVLAGRVARASVERVRRRG